MRSVNALFLLLLILLSVQATGQEPVVSNVTFSQSPTSSGTQVNIYYDLSSPGGNCTVAAYLSRNGGATFPSPIVSATGDIGPNVTPGIGKHIVWNVSADCPNETIAQACIRIVADLFPPDPVYGVGTHDITYTDPSRGNRSITCRIRYPGAWSGPDAPVAGGPGVRFPAVVFGHGWLTPTSDYTYLWNQVVPAGYIMIMVDTEGGALPDQEEFARDIAFVVDRFQMENTNPASMFYGKVASASAAAGHSMGGGASIVATLYSANIDTIVTLAAAQNSAPVIADAALVTQPALMLSGASDCVAPPGDHQIPMYNAMPSVCKYFVSIVKGSHCQFCEDSTNCIIAQTGLCLGRSYVDRGTQETLTGSIMIHWLDAKLKGRQSRWLQFDPNLNAYVQSNLITYTASCSASGVGQSGAGLLETVLPYLTSFTIEGPRAAAVTFSEDMLWSSTGTPANYTITGAIGTLSANPSSIESLGGNAYRLTWASGEMLDGGIVSLTVAGVQDGRGNPIGVPNSANALGAGIPPAGSLLINGGADSTMSVDVQLTLSGSDADSGVAYMAFSNDGSSWSGWEPYATSTTWPLSSGDGLKTVYVRYRDAAGNVSTGAITDTITLDTTAPTVSAVTVQTRLTVRVTFSEAIQTPAVTDPVNYAVSGSGQGSLTLRPDSVALVSGTTYELAWNSGEMYRGGDITITVTGVQDLAGNPVGTPNAGTHAGGGIGERPTAAAGTIPPVDETSPGAPYDFALIYRDNVSVKASTLDGNDIDVTGPNGFIQLATFVSVDPATGDGTPLTATYRITPPGGTWDPADQGFYTIAQQAGQVTDTAGNAAVEGTIDGFLVNFSPTAALSTTAPDPTNAPIAVNVILSEASADFDAGDIQTTNAGVSGFSGNGTLYSFTLTASGQGLFSATVPAGRFTDSLGKPNLESNTVSRTFDGVGPTVTLSSTSPDPTNTAITVTAALSKSSTNFGLSDVTTTNANVSNFSGTGTSYSFTLTAIAQGAFSCQVPAGRCTDSLGNPNAASNLLSRTYDSVGPQITLASGSGPYVNAAIAVAAALNETSADFGPGDIVTTNATVIGFSGSAMAYSFTLTPGVEGLFSCTVPAGRCTDALGNANSGSNTLSRTYDITPPAATITRLANPTGANTIGCMVSFGEVVAPTFTSEDVTLTGTLAGVVNVGGGPSYTVSVVLSDPDADGTVSFSVGTGVTDRAGNPYAGGVSPLCDIYNWLPPYFTPQPVGGDKYTGDSHSLDAIPHCGASTMTYQWKWDNGFRTIYDGPTTPTWSWSSLAEGDQGRYWCEVVYDGETHATDTVTLNVAPHLEITVDPVGGEELAGGRHTFTVAATGGYGPLIYQWKKDGSAILSAPNAPEFTLDALQVSDTGRYSVEVRDANTDVRESQEADLIVNSPGLPVAGMAGVIALLSFVTLAGLRISWRR